MTMPSRKDRYTFADILEWPEDVRVELIDGEIYMMSPPPTTKHQEISMELSLQIGGYLKGKSCKVFHAPFGVRLFEEPEDDPEDSDTMVEPDLAIICDPGKLDKHGCKGAPDMVVEILSPATRRRDSLVKLNLYQQAGVREYWIVDPETETVMVHLLGEDGIYRVQGHGRGDTVKVNVLEDCQVVLAEVFPEESE